SIASILAIPTLSGMNTAITQAVSRGYEGSLIPALKTKIRWGLFGALASLILAGYYYFNNNSTLATSFLIISIFLPFMDSFTVYGSLLNGRKLFKVSTKYQIITQIIAVAIMIGALFLSGNLFIILLAYFISWTLLRFIFLKITLKTFKPNNKQDPQTISYGKHLSLMGIMGAIADNLDKILLWYFLGAAPLAIYAFAIAMPEQIKGLLKIIPALVLPKFSQRSSKEIKKNIFSKMLKLEIIIAVIVAIYILFAPFIYKILFPQYIESIFYSQIFALSLLTVSATLPYTALVAKKAQKELYQFNFFSSIFQIVILFFMIYFYGLMGAILARVFTRFFNIISCMWLIKKI
ncbi:MAG: oligosaccharide flippase family protein, partial [Patescibacteria group bacterium]